MIDVGPWRFTRQDAERTLDVLPEVVAHAAWRRPADAFEALHRRAEALRSSTDTLEERLRAAWTLMSTVRATVESAGLLPVQATGEISGLFISSGGVPKSPVDRVTVQHAGVVGDRQATRRHHGRPWQALCVWSADVVNDFVAAGHPLLPGAAGENVSVRSLPWEHVRPGVRLRLGSVLCEVSSYAIPCRKNGRWFADGRFQAIHHSKGPVSRVYATVLEPGSSATGDVAVLEP